MNLCYRYVLYDFEEISRQAISQSFFFKIYFMFNLFYAATDNTAKMKMVYNRILRQDGEKNYCQRGKEALKRGKCS